MTCDDCGAEPLVLIETNYGARFCRKCTYIKANKPRCPFYASKKKHVRCSLDYAHTGDHNPKE